MIDFFEFVLWLLGGVLLVYVAHQIIMMVMSVVYWLTPSLNRQEISTDKGSFGIIIPAHNEELLIGQLVESIQKSNYPADKYHIFVIADNCDADDRTAEIARTLGADVRERTNREQRGKPYALDWLISSINLDDFDAYVIIDADTAVDRDFLDRMNDSIKEGHEVIQGYFGVMNPDENWLTRLSILPGVVKYLMHFPGKKLLGLSCPLAGNGMCFSKAIFKRYGWNAFSVAENWEYYAQLTLDGYVVSSNENAIIYSQVAKSLKTGKDQRQRWQKGRIETLQKYWSPLIKASIQKFSPVFLDAVIEISKPSHAILFATSFVYFSGIAALFAVSGEFLALLYFSGILFLLQIMYFLSGLIVQKAPLKTWVALLMVPPYLAWKIIITVSGIFANKGKSWIKTQRH